MTTSPWWCWLARHNRYNAAASSPGAPSRAVLSPVTVFASLLRVSGSPQSLPYKATRSGGGQNGQDGCQILVGLSALRLRDRFPLLGKSAGDLLSNFYNANCAGWLNAGGRGRCPPGLDQPASPSANWLFCSDERHTAGRLYPLRGFLAHPGSSGAAGNQLPRRSLDGLPHLGLSRRHGPAGVRQSAPASGPDWADP